MTSNHSAWVLIANSNICRIYEYSKKPLQLKLLKEVLHPENKLKNMDLTTDKPGRYQSSSAPGGAYSPATDAKEVNIENFSREMAKELDNGRNTNLYDKLIIVSPPHMNGLISQHLNKHIKNLISHNIKKDVMHLPEQELLRFLQDHTQYPDQS